MKKFLLSLCVAMLSVVGAWAQFYKFTDTAQGRLYTSADESADPADTPKGAVCDKSYYVKSDYTQTDAPTKTEVKTFSTKQYFVLIGENYTSAYGQEYDEDKTYATANGNQLAGSGLTDKLTDSYVFTNSGSGKIAYRKVDDTYVQVQVGDVCNPEENYYWNANPSDYSPGSDIISWNSMTKAVQSFSSIDGIYVKDGDVYVAITSALYDKDIEYYTLSYTNLTDDEETAMADNSANFNTKYVVTGLSDPSGIFYYNAGAYTEVENGDEFLGDDKYYVNTPGFTLRTPAELLALCYVKEVSGLVTLEPDGTTLNVICSGDVCDPDDDFESNAQKFKNLPTDWLYSDENGTVVKNGDIYYNTWEYKTRKQAYRALTGEGEDYITTNTYYILNNGVDIFSYDSENKIYTKIAEDADVTNGTFYGLTLGTDIQDLTDYKEEKTTFQDKAQGWIYKADKIWEDWSSSYKYDNLTAVNPGDVFVESTENKVYVVLTRQNETWGAREPISDDDLKTQEYISTDDYIKSDKGVYIEKSEGVYQTVAGTKVDDELTYYATLTAAQIDQRASAYSTPNTTVDTQGKEYFTCSEGVYTQVYNGASFAGSQEDYYVKNGFDYFVNNDLDSYLTVPESVAANYWQALANDINKNKYETVVFATKEGDAEHATICEHVTRAMMKTTTVNALDYQFVQIASLEPLSVYVDGSWQDNPKSTFWASSANTSVTVLLLPEIKNAKDVNGVKHRHVPQVCNNFSGLELIVMPNNATCIEEDAFVRNSFGGGITEYQLKTIVFNNTLKRIGKNAFNGHIGLKNLTFPASIEYIGTTAFDGGINDVYFLGETAPIVEKNAFSDKAYLNNNSIQDNAIDKDWYRIDRNAYIKDDYMAAMLHVPSGLSAAQTAAYTDPTRDYHVFEWLPYEIATDEPSEEAALNKYPFAIGAETKTIQGQTKVWVKFNGIASSDKSKEVEYTVPEDGTKKIVYYCSGDAAGPDVSPSWGSCSTSFNFYDCGGLTWGETGWINGYNHNKMSGLYDLYKGENYVWPCHYNMQRAFTVASNGLLWNGTSTIADGIHGTSKGVTGNVTATYDSDCDGVDDKSYTDGNEYMGLHEFILLSADVAPGTNTQEWDFNTIAGANWYTICVPVSMTVEEVRATFGDDTQVCKFNNVSRDSEDKIKFGFTDEQCYGKTDLSKVAIEANYAYMIRPSKYKDADTKFVLPQYTIADKVIPIPTTITCTDANDNNPDKVYSYTFIGNYNTNADGTPLYMQQYCYYLGIDKNDPNIHKLFMQSGNTGKWKPYSCVIIPSDGKSDFDTFFDPNRSNTNKSKATTCYFGMDSYEEEGNGATAIEYTVVCGSEKNSPIFNLNGQIVGNNIDKLPQGVYVKNGKKFIVK